MTDTQHEATTTVYFASKPFAIAKLKDTDMVAVSLERPEPGDWSALYELHPPTDALRETGDGTFEIEWGEATRWPHQITST